MSKLLNNYINLKKQDSETIYLFKNGIFYVALQDDAKFLSKTFNLKLTNLNSEAIKCGFPCSNFDKYYIGLNSLNKRIKIIDKDIISEADTYLKNDKISKLISEIKNLNIENLSISEAFAFIEKLQTYVDTLK